MQEALPDFKNPPVIETVLGVQFEPLQKFTNAHLGAFWKKLPKEWDSVSDAETLEPVFEEFGDERSWVPPGIQLKISRDPSTRLRIRNQTNDRMIQIQNSRFHYNWLGQSGRQYPRFKNVKPEFDDMFNQYKQFVLNESLGDIIPNQWEITYVNHIPKGTVWNSPSDWERVFPSISRKNDCSTVGSLESFECKLHYELEDRRGRLHIEIRHGKRDNSQEILIMNLTARGPIRPDGILLDEGLNLGRNAIVRAFAELTAPDAHKFWEIQNDSNKK